MKKYKDIKTIRKQFISITCDKCGKTITNEEILDLQEWLQISFIAGYGSIFDDGEEYQCDLCQQCTKELLGDYLIKL